MYYNTRKSIFDILFNAKKNKDVKVIFNGKATIVYIEGKKYVQKCTNDDYFDAEKGVLLAIAKDNGYSYKDIQKYVKEAKIQTPLKKDNTNTTEKKIKSIKRHANIGEYILITNEDNFFLSRYKNGDILKVIDTTDILDMVIAKVGHDSVFIFDTEYEVLENYKPNGE